MPSPKLPFPVFDADNHLYETTESLTKYLPERYRSAVKYVQMEGRTKIAIRGVISEYIPNPTFEVVARPGAMEDYYKHGNPEGKSRREIFGKPIKAVPAFREPAPRLELLDELNVDRTLMFPTLASLVEERMRDDPEMIHAVTHALNEWLHEVWSFNYKDRIFTAPVVSLPIVDAAIQELNWVAERGAKVILVRPAPVPGYRGSRSFALPEFDPFWSRVSELGILVAMHSSDSGYSRYSSEWEGRSTEHLPFKPDAFRMLSSWRPIADSVGSWVCHGALYRHPDLKVAVIENGATWLPPLLAELKNLWKKMPDAFPSDPVEMVKSRIYISPFWEEDLAELAGVIGADHILFGSDYPHPEGLAEPTTYIEHLAGLTPDEQALIMGGNLARLLA